MKNDQTNLNYEKDPNQTQGRNSIFSYFTKRHLKLPLAFPDVNSLYEIENCYNQLENLNYVELIQDFL